MVNIQKIESALLELELFFSYIKNNSKIDMDVENALFGLSTTKSIKTLIEKYKKKPENRVLKKIDAGLVSATRGVEYFENYNDNKRFREICAGIPSLKEHIKW
ncbi:hypothetical protein AB9P05_19530 [Roseivirga sp. BDSF3-8]|uniref:hypothetical protein n=1 Tax=Roseivirga sp. BDSF3-8 TaxID=3241598 RepID=UPI003531D034